MGSNNNSATDWADYAGSLAEEVIQENGYEYPSLQELPIDTMPAKSESPLEEAERMWEEFLAQQAEINRQREQEYKTRFHGESDPASLSVMREKVKNGEMDPADFFIQTAQIFEGRGRAYAGERKSRASNDRDNELYGPGINVSAPGLDKWHQMNPKGTPAAPSRLGEQSPLLGGRVDNPIQVKPPWANANREAAKIQTPVQPPRNPMKVQSSSLNDEGDKRTTNFITKHGTVFFNKNPIRRKKLNA